MLTIRDAFLALFAAGDDLSSPERRYEGVVQRAEEFRSERLVGVQLGLDVVESNCGPCDLPKFDFGLR